MLRIENHSRKLYEILQPHIKDGVTSEVMNEAKVLLRSIPEEEREDVLDGLMKILKDRGELYVQ